MIRCFFCVQTIEPITELDTAVKVLLVVVGLGLLVYLLKRFQP